MKITRLLMVAVLAVLLAPATLRAQDRALDAAKAAVQANPKDAVAHFNLGLLHFNRQSFDEALPSFEQAVKLDSKDKTAKEMLETTRGVQAYFKKDHKKAAESFKKALSYNPQNQSAGQLLGNCYLYMKEYDKAEKSYQDYLKAFPNNKDAAKVANQNLSKLYIDQKRYPEAITALKNLLAADPKNADAHNNLGVVYFRTKDFTNAAASWEKALKIRPKDAQALKFLGFSYYNQGKFKEAISRYESSLKLEKNDPELYFNMAVAYLDNGQYDRSAEAFGAALKIDPKDSSAATGQVQAIAAAINNHMERGSNLYLDNEYSGAIKEWKAVLRYQNDHKEAKAFIEDAESKLKGEVDKHLAAGREYIRKGRNVDALRELDLALAMDPNNAEAKAAKQKMVLKRSEKVGSFLEQGNEYLAAKDYPAAIQKFRAALRENNADAKAKAALAKAKTAQKTAYDKAVAAGKKATDAKDFRRAIHSLEEAKRIDPSSAEASNLLFRARSRMRSYVKETLDEGESLFAAGQKDKARERFLKVVALEEDNALANDYIKRLTGQQSQAKADSEKVKTLYYDGVNLYINGKINEAITSWKECLRLDPGYTNAQKNIDKAMVKLQSLKKLGQN